jgi:serpin B
MKKMMTILLATVVMVGGCSAQSANQDSPAVKAASYRAELAEQPIEPLNAGFVSAVNGFGLDAAKRLYNTDENLALSPANIELALCMTRIGASGDTTDEMAKTLGITGLSDSDIIKACKSLMWRANTGGMEAANAIWLGDKYTFSNDFVKTCTGDFFADAFPLVIPGAKDAINAWADEKTHGRIKDIIAQELPETTPIVLANALYYLGEWEMPFEANDTWDEEFATPSGNVTTAFMHSNWSVPYYKNDDFSMITLDFKSEEGEGEYAMAFLLPAEGSNVNEMLEGLNADAFSQALESAKEQEVWIKLPKFEFSYFAELKDTLAAMGMQKALSLSDADFSAMTNEENEIYIEQVLHKCYIRVDELGAEAAAVTAVVAGDGAAPIEEEPPKFYADRPFLFAIYSQEDGTIAFLGAVNNPTKE